MIVLIPLGGLGTRFSNSGYNLPKPLINVMGKQIIFWLLDNLNLVNIKHIIIHCVRVFACFFKNIVVECYS